MFGDDEGLGLLLGYYLLQVPHNTEGCVLLGGEARGHTEGVGHTSIVVTLVTGSSLRIKFRRYVKLYTEKYLMFRQKICTNRYLLKQENN